MIIKEVTLTAEEIKEIQDFNTELVTFRNLVKEMNDSTTEFIFNKIIASLKTAQFNYDNWFLKMQEKYKIETKPEYKWNVDFGKKTLQLLS